MNNSEVSGEKLFEIVKKSDEIDAKNRERGARFLKGWEIGTMLVDVADQDETLSEIIEKARRATGRGALEVVGIVEPTDEMIMAWAQVHMAHSLLALDNEYENIVQRIIDDSLVVVLSPQGEDVLELYRKEKRREAYEAIPQEVWTRANRPSSRGGMTSSAGRWVAKLDFDGDLGGGQPKNPLRVGGK